ncbi:MAG: ferritin-like domain-containing protein [Thermoproteota archaeon]|nr:ferritin-like domain-containing protein [Thermoproteota archaeon]
MLENDLHAEQVATRKLRERIQFVQSNNDYGTDEMSKTFWKTMKNLLMS